MDQLIVNFAPTGMLMRKKDTPFVPITAEEIVEDVRKACEIGISCVHLHPRDPRTEDPVWKKEYFEEIIIGIREFAPELVISVTTSGRLYNEFEKRSDVLNLEGWAKPDMASLTLSSLNFNKTASINAPDMIRKLAERMKEQGICPELEVFDAGMINYAKYLIKKGIIQPPFYFNLLMGNIACAQADLLHAGVLLNDLPEESIPVIGGIGNAQLKMNALAIAMGYGVRIGLEDNIWYDEGRTVLATNEAYLTRIHSISDALGRPVCSGKELRRILHLKPGNGEYGLSC